MQIASHPHNIHSALNARLRGAFPLTDADLDANRAGQLTPAQRVRLEEHKDRPSCAGWIALMISLPLICMFLVNQTTDPSSDGSTALLCLGGVILASLILILGLGVDQSLKQDINSGSVMSVQGKIHLKHRRERRSFDTYFAVINQETYRIRIEVYEAMAEGESYRLYYVPHSKFVVAAEHVESSIPS